MPCFWIINLVLVYCFFQSVLCIVHSYHWLIFLLGYVFLLILVYITYIFRYYLFLYYMCKQYNFSNWGWSCNKMKLFTISGFFFIPCLRIPIVMDVVAHAYNPSSLKAVARGSLLEASTFYIASFSQSCLARLNSKEQEEKRECTNDQIISDTQKPI